MPHYTGNCIGGPYAGEEVTHYATVLKVNTLEGMLIRTGRYEYFNGVWRWAGHS